MNQILELTNQRNIEIEIEQNHFLESTLGKTINKGIDLGLRVLLPDLIENQVIDIKNTLLNEGLGAGIKKAVSSAIDLGKSAVGVFTGKFENISQAQTAIQKGGIIDNISEIFDNVIDKTKERNLIPNTITNTLRSGKNTLLNTISNNIENEFNSQLKSVERIQKYSDNWKKEYENRNFELMTKEIYKLNAELKKIMPLENTINEARKIQNLHTLIKNNGKNFDLTEEEIKLIDVFK